MVKKFKISISISLFVLSFNAVFSQDITYGTSVEKIHVRDCFSKEFILPFSNAITVIYFFNNKNPNQVNNLLELEYLYNNLNIEKSSIGIVAISSSNNSNLQSIYRKYKLEFFLVNDEYKLAKRFQASCESCLRVIIVDKHSKIRYLSSQFDGTFLRDIIQRYSAERL